MCVCWLLIFLSYWLLIYIYIYNIDYYIYIYIYYCSVLGMLESTWDVMSALVAAHPASQSGLKMGLNRHETYGLWGPWEIANVNLALFSRWFGLFSQWNIHKWWGIYSEYMWIWLYMMNIFWGPRNSKSK